MRGMKTTIPSALVSYGTIEWYVGNFKVRQGTKFCTIYNRVETKTPGCPYCGSAYRFPLIPAGDIGVAFRLCIELTKNPLCLVEKTNEVL